MLEVTNKVIGGYNDIADGFPDVDPGVEPLGSRVIVQIRKPKRITAGGIILTKDAIETDQWNMQVAMVRAVGPVAFHNRNTLEEWPEGAWVKPGDFVRVPKNGGDKWTMVVAPATEHEEAEEIIFVTFNDLDLIGRVTGDPLKMRAYV